MPGVTTIIDNLNVISQKTRELIFDRQIARILGEGLDDFKALTIDSTSVKANVHFAPCDSPAGINAMTGSHRHHPCASGSTGRSTDHFLSRRYW